MFLEVEIPQHVDSRILAACQYLSEYRFAQSTNRADDQRCGSSRLGRKLALMKGFNHA